MASFELPNVEGLTSIEELKNAVGKMTKELSWLLNNLDWKNVNELNIGLDNGAFIRISNDGITINDGNMITFQADVNGKVTMTGAKIQSKNGYPLVIMDPDNELFGAYKDERNSIQIQADFGGAPSLNFITNGNVVGRLNTLLGSLEIDSVGTLSMFVQNGNIDVSACRNLITPKFSNVVSSTGENLAVILDEKATAGVSTNPSGSHNHGIPDGTILRTADGGTVTFRAASAHTHEQTS